VEKRNQIFFSGSSREKLAFLPVPESEKSLLLLFFPDGSEQQIHVSICVCFLYISQE